jgi:EmrB/QacA subfamily drug resistance transporter
MSGAQGDEEARRRAVFVVTSLGAFMATLDLSIVNIAFPSLEAAFPGSSEAALTWVITGYSVVFGALLVVAGRTADRIGARRVFFAGLLVFCGGSALCGLAPWIGWLVGARLVQAVGAAAMLPASLGLLLVAYPVERRSHIVALWSGIGALAVATGPTLGALLITAFDWRAVFFVNLPVGLVAWQLGRRNLDNPAIDSDLPAPDYVGSAILVVGLAAIVLAVSEGPDWGWTSAGVIGSVVVAVLALALFVRRSLHHPDPVLDLTLFRSRSFSVAGAATFAYAMGFFAMLLGNILFLTGVWGFTTLEAGLAVTPGPLVVAVVAGRAGKLAARIGFRPVLLAGSLTFAIGLAWFAVVVGTTPHYFTEFFPGQLICGLGIGLTFPVLGAAVVAGLPPERLSLGSAVGQTWRQVGGAIGVSIMAVILGAPATRSAAMTRFDHMWFYAAAMALTCGAICLLLNPRSGRPAPAPAAAG